MCKKQSRHMKVTALFSAFCFVFISLLQPVLR